MSTFGRLIGSLVGKRRVATVSVDEARSIEDALAHGEPVAARAHLARLDLPDSDPRRDRWLGMLAALEGRHDEALTRLTRATGRAPHDAGLQVAAGMAARAAGQPLQAARFWSAARDLAPGSQGLQFNIAAALADAKRHDEALGAARRAVGEMPGDVRPLLLVGAILEAAGDPAAGDAWADARAIEPDNVDAWAGTGRVLRDGGHFGAAAEAFAHAGPQLQLDLALALFHARRHGEALAQIEGLLAEQPGREDAALVRANILLASGELSRGWQAYESRLRIPGVIWPARGAIPWDGSRLEGTLLVDCEQGFGDCFLGARVLAAARARVTRLVLRCPATLVDLFAASGIADAVVVDGTGVDAQAHAFLLSLPALADAGEPRRQSGYLRAPDSRVAAWKRRLAGDRPAIGLVWSGAHTASQNRYRSFDPFPLVECLREDFMLHSLQIAGPGIPGCPPGVIDLAPELTDFAETAAALVALDGLVSAETSVAHLAGALGTRAVVPLPLTSDWRWEIAGEQNPWYSTLWTPRLRQPGDWAALWPETAQWLRAAPAPT